jgi:hypothetical protein
VTPIACALDHILWSVSDLDASLACLCDRLGFPLLYGPAGSKPERIADIGLGSAWVRLVERSEWPQSKPVSLALRTALPLQAAELEARRRGFETGGVFVAGGRERKGGFAQESLPLVAFVLVRGVVAPEVPGLLLVRYFGDVHLRRVNECLRFVNSPASAYGLHGAVSVRVEVAEEAGCDRWASVLGRTQHSGRNCWALAEGGCVEAALTREDRISAIVLGASNLRLLKNAWADAGVDSEFRDDDTLVVSPDSAGGLRILVRLRPPRA